MKKLAIATLLLLSIAAAAVVILKDPGTSDVHFPSPVRKPDSLATDQWLTKLRVKAGEARQFIQTNGYNSHFYFLIDLSLPSGRNRFFIYDLQKDSLVNSGLVTHGNCNQYWLEGRKYGNTVGCGCSSLGKYKIGHPYQGRFGLAFKLHGLQASNSNAFARYVVLHSHSCVPETEVPDEICQSNGCPTVSPSFLKVLEQKIKGSKKPVLLWMIE